MSTAIKRILLSNRVTEEDLIELDACQEGIDIARQLLPAALTQENIDDARNLGVDVDWFLDWLDCSIGFGDALEEGDESVDELGYGFGCHSYPDDINRNQIISIGVGQGVGQGCSGYFDGHGVGFLCGNGNGNGNGNGPYVGYNRGHGHGFGFGDASGSSVSVRE